MQCIEIIFLTGFIVVFLFLFNQENLYMIHLDSDLFYDICNPTKLIQSKIESLTFVNVSNPTLTSFLLRSESKSSFITSSALS